MFFPKSPNIQAIVYCCERFYIFRKFPTAFLVSTTEPIAVSLTYCRKKIDRYSCTRTPYLRGRCTLSTTTMKSRTGKVLGSINWYPAHFYLSNIDPLSCRDHFHGGRTSSGTDQDDTVSMTSGLKSWRKSTSKDIAPRYSVVVDCAIAFLGRTKFFSLNK